MIRYALTCGDGHAFESWFRDSAAFDAQHGAGQLACPICDSARVEKALMAPSIAGRSTEPAPALLDERAQALRAMARRVRADMLAKAENVGRAFPADARRMHDGLIEPRPIYGEATTREVRALLDDGIAVGPIPDAPEDGN